MNIQKLIKKVNNRIRKRHFVLTVCDCVCFFGVTLFYYSIAKYAAFSLPVSNSLAFTFNFVGQCLCVFLMRAVLGVYQNVWRYANTKAYFSLVIADALGSIIALIGIRLMHILMPGVYYGLWQIATIGALNVLLTLISRFAYSLLYRTSSKSKYAKLKAPVAIVGAGQLGAHLADDLLDNQNSEFEPMFYIDTDKYKIGNKISGLMIYSPAAADKLIQELGIQDVIISITSKIGEEMDSLYHHYRDLGCRVRIYDSLVSKKNQRGRLREVSIEDLLFRRPLEVSDKKARAYYGGKTILITGGGGSIGSELCRQIAACGPRKLIIFDIYENNAYDIQQELIRTYEGKLNLCVEIGSVRDVDRLDELFRTHRPEVVFHAAAHKHVPLMESSAAEAIKNNCLGTYNTANASEKYGVERFILISTDKAVNPTNMMGASKRVCEMIIQCRTDSNTRFAAVRFGNVLGSNGSVIPLFKRQIAAGGPVTITDKRIIRYFMTISEASQLVILAGAMAQRGELFVLDMGRPIKIYDLARNLIELSGLEVDKDIEIREIGLRPGEKLYEELLMKTERMEKTDNDLIFVEHDQPYSRHQVDEKLNILLTAVKQGGNIQAAMASVVPTYRTPGEVNLEAEQSEEMRKSLIVTRSK